MKTWKKQVEEEIEMIGPKKEDTLNRAIWQDGKQSIAEGMS